MLRFICDLSRGVQLSFDLKWGKVGVVLVVEVSQYFTFSVFNFAHLTVLTGLKLVIKVKPTTNPNILIFLLAQQSIIQWFRSSYHNMIIEVIVSGPSHTTGQP